MNLIINPKWHYKKRGLLWGLLTNDVVIVENEFAYQTEIKGYTIKTDYCILNKFGLLIIKKDFKCNGGSGLTFDCPRTVPAAIVHDALGTLLIDKFLPWQEAWKVNLELYKIMRLNGCSCLRAMSWLFAVETAGVFWMRPR